MIIQTQHYATSSIVEKGDGIIVVDDENGKEISRFENGKDFIFQKRVIGGMPILIFTRYFYGLAGEPNIDVYINLGAINNTKKLKVLNIRGAENEITNKVISSFESFNYR